MRTITVFETPRELLYAVCRDRVEGDKSPCLPLSVYLVVEENSFFLSGEGSEAFTFGEKLTFEQLFNEMAKNAGFSKVHWT